MSLHVARGLENVGLVCKKPMLELCWPMRLRVEMMNCSWRMRVTDCAVSAVCSLLAVCQTSNKVEKEPEGVEYQHGHTSTDRERERGDSYVITYSLDPASADSLHAFSIPFFSPFYSLTRKMRHS